MRFSRATSTRVVMSIIFIFSLLSSIIFLSGAEGNFFSDFFDPGLSHGPSFSGNQLYAYDVGLGQVKGSIECFGDFNSDKYTDAFILSEDRTFVEIYLWDHDEWSFRLLEGSRMEETNITNVAAGDFNHDGKLDVLISSSTKEGDTRITLWLGHYVSLGKRFELPSANGSEQLLVFDGDADLKIDLFGTHNGKRSIWNNKGDGVFEVNAQGEGLTSLARPNSNAFVDIDGDCLSDLLITSSTTCTSQQCEPDQLEIWLNKKGHFELDKTLALPKGTGQLSYSDLNGDGTMDVLFPVCSPFPSCSEENSIYIIYNIQKPLCKHEWAGKNEECRSVSNLCSSDATYSLTIPIAPNQTSSDFVVIPGNRFGGWPTRHFSFHPDFHSLTIRTGDYNLDGYPDILVPLVGEITEGDKVVNVATVELWANVKCNEDLCGDAATDAGLRTFTKVTKGTDILSEIQNAYAAAFFDLDENGIHDIVVLTDPAIGRSKLGETSKSIKTIYNNYFNDAFFLKTMGLNGVCPAWCPDGNKFPSPKPYGVNLPGASFKYTINDLSGDQRVNQGVQLQQSGYLALQTPYILFGLGRTSNYIEQVYMGVPIKNGKEHWHMWICIIPNSQLVAIPYPPSSPIDWPLELYIKSSGLTLWIVVAIISCLLIIGGVISFFKWKEKREDEKLKQETAHLFSFDAL